MWDYTILVPLRQVRKSFFVRFVRSLSREEHGDQAGQEGICATTQRATKLFLGAYTKNRSHEVLVDPLI